MKISIERENYLRSLGKGHILDFCRKQGMDETNIVTDEERAAGHRMTDGREKVEAPQPPSRKEIRAQWRRVRVAGI